MRENIRENLKDEGNLRENVREDVMYPHTVFFRRFHSILYAYTAAYKYIHFLSQIALISSKESKVRIIAKHQNISCSNSNYKIVWNICTEKKSE